MTLDGVTSFSRFKNIGNTCDACVTIKVINGILHDNGGKWKKAKNKFAFSSFLVLKSIKVINGILHIMAENWKK